MKDIINTIVENYQVRKSYDDKTRFINYLKGIFKEKGINLNIDSHGKIIKSRNIIVGDIDNADVIFTAHYDTCAKLPVPNFITPKNILIYILYSLFLAGIMILTAFLCSFLSTLIFHNEIISKAVYFIVLILDIFLTVFGKANKHTANDNTSGVITLLSIIFKSKRENLNKSAFVFFDNEELGLIGSSAFKKKYDGVLSDKLIINFDCVSDGDNIMFVFSKKAMNTYVEYNLSKTFNKYKDKYNKNILIEKTSNTFYPSDQMLFKNSIGVAALKKKPFIGYYMNRIHTKKDVIFDEKNIGFLCETMLDLPFNYKNPE